ncbi:GNAT family N-acetyltransferase [Primorskyibacter aestuariivivens]|uniref:GNAT family N-acetyltransferase n=1 Tax=Primorskyibacter aestuariivivens TaxID=1888912 RepID=UPI002301787E|nr:GNAT family N-acetyltransferase [Primorskyibacter aestuariivivens]MDA7427459.1 GNAT family N-acetyltransferase [Primorskyibacter aestuariivivens]
MTCCGAATLCSSGAITRPRYWWTTLPLISRAQPALLASGSYFVAVRDGAVVGAGGWTMQAPGGRPGLRGVGHIRHVVTDHRQTRQGIGRRLMTHVMWYARAAGCEALHCQSTLTAVPFYAALGFVAQGRIEVELPRGITFPAEFMIARL